MSAGGVTTHNPPTNRLRGKGSVEVEFTTPGAAANRLTTWQFEDEEPPVNSPIVGINPGRYELKFFVARPHRITSTPVPIRIVANRITRVTVRYRGR